MQFNSTPFLFLFLPVFLALYYLPPAHRRTPLLILGSFVFYAFSCSGQYWTLLLLLGAVVLSYGAGLVFDLRKDRSLLAATLGLFGLTLIFLKVFAGGKYLPAGASFFLFQVSAYTVAVYRDKAPCERSFRAYCAQTVMFPKLLSGPLMDPKELSTQHRQAKPDGKNLHDGLQLLIIGLGLKVLLANRLGGLWAQPAVLGYENISTAAAWLSIVGYTMQLYFDFFGYSLMAIGIGKMLGYDLPANFRDPYASKTVSEFYRRWHITLGAWFRENVYFPLGGSRGGTGKTIFNLAVVWAFTGLWHGVGGNYMLWAGYLLFFIILEKLFLGKILNKSRILCHLYLVPVIVISWIPFAIGDFRQMILFCGRLFGVGGNLCSALDFGEWIRMYAWLLGAGAFLMTPLPGKIFHRIRGKLWTDIVLVVIFWLVVYFISTAAQDPFMYFQY